ncbi:MAG: NAD-dependent epimerase/dehydratase family protein [Oscillospiraceae bacterium]|nr:NAD-dependent epimerase/dehydratase family protein [Oscillospiraceae bacterium]
MPNIIIIGENSYIGNAFEAFARKELNPNIKKISSRNEAWKNENFSQADCVLFCAGIAHKKAEDELHFAVNRDLAVETAKKAKKEKVPHFIYISSAAVFGNDGGTVNPRTPPNPRGAYGESKFEAENELKKLSDVNDNGFILTIVRPPMVYGAGCKGNFPRLVRLSEIMPLFPDIDNKRSMIYIENLCFFLLGLIEDRRRGVFFPQNAEYQSTSAIYRQIREVLGKKSRLTKLFNPFIYFFCNFLSPAQKLFGDFVYSGSDFEKIDFIGFKTGIKRSVENPRKT